MYRENERIQKEQDNSDIFRRFLEDLAGSGHLGGESIVSHSRSILRVFSKELPEKLYHSKRYSSQSTDGSISGVFSPHQNQNSVQSPNESWVKDSGGHKRPVGLGEERGDCGLFGRPFMSRCFSDGLMFSQSNTGQADKFCSGEILDLELELEGESEERGLAGKVKQKGSGELGKGRGSCDHSNSTSAASSSSSSAAHSPSSSTPTSRHPTIYRVMTSTTVAFPSYGEDGMERLNMALREDRIRRISTHSNRAWPANVTAYLKGIDIFLRIPEYVRPSEDGAALNLSIGSCCHPHPSKVHYGGEDAHFYEENVIGIADGVGEWANFGINPKLFASELISGMREAYLNSKCMQPAFPPNDVAILKKNTAHACGELDVGCLGADGRRVPESQRHGRLSRGTRLKFDRSYVDGTGYESLCDGVSEGREEGHGFCGGPGEVSLSQFLLMEGYRSTRSFGSSTAFVACFDPKTSRLQISYLGDSGIIVLRRTPETFRMGIVYRSPVQQHSFNCPFQLSRLPTREDFPGLQEKGLTCFINLVKSSGEVPQDLPSHSISKEITVSQSDLIVVATDGLFDNLFDYEICSICSGAISPYESIRLLNDPKLYSSPHSISKALANAAYSKSLDPKAKTPFNKHCNMNSEMWQFSTGGKLDDITVVVAWVVSERDQIILSCRPDKLKY
ncbi:Ptc7p phosphatase [Cryptosporidium canis]|uniref:Protein phosphatase n=1 Tax=Cryptosporidium canis TaxID=195482 RepID=A0ABQ8PA19_9CRYT|nr:Ptc7p phosphatase [Cryptosporidium canis]